jgi:hypothetical protein
MHVSRILKENAYCCLVNFYFTWEARLLNFVGLHIPTLQEANVTLAGHVVLWERHCALRSASGVPVSPGTYIASVIPILHKTVISARSLITLTRWKITKIRALLFSS